LKGLAITVGQSPQFFSRKSICFAREYKQMKLHLVFRSPAMMRSFALPSFPNYRSFQATCDVISAFVSLPFCFQNWLGKRIIRLNIFSLTL